MNKKLYRLYKGRVVFYYVRHFILDVKDNKLLLTDTFNNNLEGNKVWVNLDDEYLWIPPDDRYYFGYLGADEPYKKYLNDLNYLRDLRDKKIDILLDV